MTVLEFRLVLGLLGLVAFLALVGATVYLAGLGQAVPATFTGTGAGGVAAGLFKLLTTLSQ